MCGLVTPLNFFPNLKTEHFVLREAKETDYIDVFEIYSDDEAVKYQYMEPIRKLEQAQKAVDNFRRAFTNRSYIRWCIEDKMERKVIGLITLHHFDEANRKAEIGYMLNRKYWQQNVMSECGKEILTYSFKNLKLNKIEALIHPNNLASIRLNEKLGFKRKGIRKSAAYNIKKSEFEDMFLYILERDSFEYNMARY